MLVRSRDRVAARIAVQTGNKWLAASLLRSVDPRVRQIASAAFSQNSGFSPSDWAGTSRQLLFWAGFDTGASFDVDPNPTRVNSYVEKAQGLPLAQATAANRPTLTTVDGLPSLHFINASALDLESSAYITGGPTGAVGAILACLYRQASDPADTTSNTRIHFAIGGGSSGQLRIGRFSDGANRLVVSNGAISAIDTGADTTRYFDGWCITVGWWDGSVLRGRINGREITPGASTALNLTGTRVRMGANAATTAAQFAEGDLAIATVTPSLVDATEDLATIQYLEGWLAWRSADGSTQARAKLPADHPFAFTPPGTFVDPGGGGGGGGGTNSLTVGGVALTVDGVSLTNTV